MEMIKDQSDRATAGWTGFMGTPTTKETAPKAVDLIPKKWFYKELILFLSPPSISLSPLKTDHLKYFLIQTRKKMPPPMSVEEGHVLTSEAREMEFTHSGQARMLNNLIKRHFYQEVTYMSSTYFHA